MSIIPRDVLFGSIGDSSSDLVITQKSDVIHQCSETIENTISNITKELSDKFFDKYGELYSIINEDLSKGTDSLLYTLLYRVLQRKPSEVKNIRYAYKYSAAFLTYTNLAVIAIGGRAVCENIVAMSTKDYEVRAVFLNSYDDYISLNEIIFDILMPYYDEYIKERYTFGDECRVIVDDIELLKKREMSGGMYGLGAYVTKVLPIGCKEDPCGEWCMSSSSGFDVIGSLPKDEDSDVCIRNIYSTPASKCLSFKSGNTHIVKAIDNVMSSLVLPKDGKFIGHCLLPNRSNFHDKTDWAISHRVLPIVSDDMVIHFDIPLIKEELISQLNERLKESIDIAFCRACLMTNYAMTMSQYEDGFCVDVHGGDILKDFYGVIDLRAKIMESPFVPNFDYYNETYTPNRVFSFTQLGSINLHVEIMPSSAEK